MRVCFCGGRALQVAFRTLLLVGSHTLTWKGEASSSGLLGGSKAADLFDLRLLTGLQLGEEPEAGQPVGLYRAPPELGTAIVRMHAAKHKAIKAMRDGGQCASLVFKERSVDVAFDSAAQRNAVARGFALLHAHLLVAKP